MSIAYTRALEIITTNIQTNPKPICMPLLSSIKHIAALDIFATVSLPSWDISLKDGYGVRLNDRGKCVVLDLQKHFLEDGITYELSTGDAIKEGTQAVVALEETRKLPDGIALPKDFEKGQNIKSKAEDIQAGELLLQKGEYIKASHISALASCGINTVMVYKRPTIGILSIGDKLCDIKQALQHDETYNTNALWLASRILEIGAKVYHIEKTKNDSLQIREKLASLHKKCDFIITTGAMSRYDAMQELLYSPEFTLLFHKVKIAPAGASALSIFEKKPLLHLPGLPLSAQLGFELLGAPILRTIRHEKKIYASAFCVTNKKEFISQEKSACAIPGYFDGNTFLSAPSFGAGMLNVLAKCNGYALIHNKKIIKAGEKVNFYLF
ncbi:MAG: molybdopterin molybdotransferase MoeA [Sulfurospirillum sp.]|nr:molybdopterin molybdotransferase MoeA [Sulfurospirillum sp.]